MAYGMGGNRPATQSNRPATTRPAAANTNLSSNGDRPAPILSTGLFEPSEDAKAKGVKSIGSVQLKEDVVLPAGSYVNLYTVEERKSEKSPIYRISVTAGKLKTTK